MAKASEGNAPRTVAAILVSVKFKDGTYGQLQRGDVLDNVSAESVKLLDELGYLSDES